MAASKPTATTTTKTQAFAQVVTQPAGPLSMMNFELPSCMQVPNSFVGAVMDGSTDALAESLITKFGDEFVDPLVEKIPFAGTVLLELPAYQSMRTGVSCGVLYLLVWGDQKNIQSQIEDGNLAPRQYVPDIVAAFVLKAVRRWSGDIASKVLPSLTGFLRKAESDLKSALGDVSGAPTD